MAAHNLFYPPTYLINFTPCQKSTFRNFFKASKEILWYPRDKHIKNISFSMTLSFFLCDTYDSPRMERAFSTINKAWHCVRHFIFCSQFSFHTESFFECFLFSITLLFKSQSSVSIAVGSWNTLFFMEIKKQTNLNLFARTGTIY